MSSNPNPFDKAVSTPTLSFSIKDEYDQSRPKPIGTRLGGVVKKAPEVVQSRFYGGPHKGKPMFWDSDSKGNAVPEATTKDGRTNNPVNQVVITVTCDDGEDRSFWVSFYPKAMFEAVQLAITAPDGSLRAIEAGDKLYITLSGLTSVPGKNPAYAYTAEFTKGAGVFASAPPPPPVAAVPVAPAPVVSATVTEPVLSNGFTATQLVAAGWTAEQIAALTAPVVAPAPPVAPTAPAEAPVAIAAPDAAAIRQAKIDAMSEADRKLLNL